MNPNALSQTNPYSYIEMTGRIVRAQPGETLGRLQEFQLNHVRRSHDELTSIECGKVQRDRVLNSESSPFGGQCASMLRLHDQLRSFEANEGHTSLIAKARC